MELLFLLPLLIGVAIFGLFDASSGSDDDGARTPTDNPNVPVATNDLVIGTASADLIKGSPGDDFALGGTGDDTIEGGQDDDILLGEQGFDKLYGGKGDDTLLGGAGSDTLIGLEENDILIGGAGDDLLQGGTGNDTLIGSSGKDKLEGGAGDDLLSGVDIRSDDINNAFGPLAVNLIDANDEVLATPAEALAARNAITDSLRAVYGAEATPDVINRFNQAVAGAHFSKADDELFGGIGNDTLIGDFSDTLTGGAGNDLFKVISDGPDEAVVVTDFTIGQDVLRVLLPAATPIPLPAPTFVNGATPADGVSVTVAGDVVAVLRGVTAAQLTGSPSSVVIAKL